MKALSFCHITVFNKFMCVKGNHKILGTPVHEQLQIILEKGFALEQLDGRIHEIASSVENDQMTGLNSPLRQVFPNTESI
jgi:hypothetical protein